MEHDQTAVLELIRQSGRAGMSNADLARQGLPYRQAYALTQRLRKLGKIKGYRYGAGWMFYDEGRETDAGRSLD